MTPPWVLPEATPPLDVHLDPPAELALQQAVDSHSLEFYDTLEEATRALQQVLAQVMGYSSIFQIHMIQKT